MKNVIVFLSAVLILSSCGSDSYKLSGTLVGLSDATVYLQQRVDKEYISIDSVVSVDGTFEFTGQVGIPDVYFISVEGRNGKGMIFLENSAIVLDAHKDTLWLAKVSGSSVHDEYMILQDRINAIQEKLEALYEEYREAAMAGNEAIASELQDQMEAVYKTVSETQMAFLDENPASFVAPFVVQSLHFGKEAEEVEELLAKLDPSLDASVLVGSMRRRVELLKNVAIGKMAPDFTQNDPNGNPVQLSSLLGNYLLIDFWAAWCGPCRRENPYIVAAYNKYHDRGFDILGVSLDNSKERWLKAIEMDRLAWTHVSDLKYWSNEVASLYGISSIPSNLLLNPEGKIIAKNLRSDDLHSELEKLLAP